jgi:hypothetical protein
MRQGTTSSRFLALAVATACSIVRLRPSRNASRAAFAVVTAIVATELLNTNVATSEPIQVFCLLFEHHLAELVLIYDLRCAAAANFRGKTLLSGMVVKRNYARAKREGEELTSGEKNY